MLSTDYACYHSLFAKQPDGSDHYQHVLQPRLIATLSEFLSHRCASPFMLLHSQVNADYNRVIIEEITRLLPTPHRLYGGSYHFTDDAFHLRTADNAQQPFAAQGGVHAADWIEAEQLFGTVRCHRTQIKLEPGLIHRANGGVLLLPLQTLLAQPQLWLRLKHFVITQRFDWLSPNSKSPLPIAIPSLPLTLKLILCGDHNAMAEFQAREATLHATALYTEFDQQLDLDNECKLAAWCQWVSTLAVQAGLTRPEANFWPAFIKENERFTACQRRLSLCPTWILRWLTTSAYHGSGTVDETALSRAIEQHHWRQNAIAEEGQEDILLQQVRIATEGTVIGQVNGLTIIQLEGHPGLWGEPTRITCVVYPGEGELTDVERKAELGGNIHAKATMIMHAYLAAALDQPLPISTSIAFEQSYVEVDGDSASLAAFCAFVSALAGVPIDQQIAVTGAIDQFGNVQSVGSINEKIEGFFAICQRRKLNAAQGVIIPAANTQHLNLRQDVISAVQEGKFHIWCVEHADEALHLLTGLTWRGDEQALLNRIKERIAHINAQETRQRGWLLRWLNWFS